MNKFECILIELLNMFKTIELNIKDSSGQVIDFSKGIKRK